MFILSVVVVGPEFLREKDRCDPSPRRSLTIGLPINQHRRRNYQHLYYKTGVYLFSFLIPFDISPLFCLLIKDRRTSAHEFLFDFDEKFALILPWDNPSSPDAMNGVLVFVLIRREWRGHFYNTIFLSFRARSVDLYT